MSAIDEYEEWPWIGVADLVELLRMAERRSPGAQLVAKVSFTEEATLLICDAREDGTPGRILAVIDIVDEQVKWIEES
ncbi:MAG: hypothetical protein V9F06_07405 [Thermomicrobiales bacterium]